MERQGAGAETPALLPRPEAAHRPSQHRPRVRAPPGERVEYRYFGHAAAGPRHPVGIRFFVTTGPQIRSK